MLILQSVRTMLVLFC